MTEFGYSVDAEIASTLPLLPQTDYRDLAAGRLRLKQLTAAIVAEANTAGVTARDVMVPGQAGSPEVPVRVYTPDRIASPSLLLDVHGGGFTHGDLDTDHLQNLDLARDLGAVVVSVDYRLAPEAPFPAAAEDCYAALAWSVRNAAELSIDRTGVVIHGVSAGGGLCAALALMARDRGGPAIAFQILDVPVVDDRLTSPSMRRFTDTPLWNRLNAEFSWDCYLGPGLRGTDRTPAYAAPARAQDLTGLPPAYISAMEFDPLRDEGIAYAQALLAAGVPVELHLFPGTIHGSTQIMPFAGISRRARTEKLAVLARALGVES